MNTKPYKAVSFVESSVRSALKAAGSLIADIKYDGVRLNLCVEVVTDHADDERDVHSMWLSRVSKPIPALEHLSGFSGRWAEFLADDRQPFKDGLMIDGEVMVKGVDFNTGSGLLRTKWLKPHNESFACRIPARGTKVPFHLNPERLKVVVYGVVPMDIIKSGSDYERINCLMQSDCVIQTALLEEHFPEIEWTIAESHDVFSMEELNELYENARGSGHEGLVVKDPLDWYKRGKKTGWWKMKPEEEADGVVQGLVWGTKGLANEGKVIGFEVLLENGVNVTVTNLTQALMDEFTAKTFDDAGELDAGEQVEFLAKVYAGEAFLSAYVGHQVQIGYMEETPDGSLRHPFFMCFRGTEENPQEKI